MFARNVKLVTFDVTNTLLHFRNTPGQLYGEIAAAHGVLIDPNDATKSFKTNFKHMIQSHPNFGRGSIGWQEWWKIVVRRTFQNYTKDPNAIESIASHLIQIYKTDKAWILSDGCDEILRYLQTMGVTMGVISNFDPRLNELLRNENIHQYFKFVLNSYDANCMKPDPNIYAMALNASKVDGITGAESLHIGDDYINDFVGAKNAGWQAIRITNSGKDAINSPNTFPSLIEAFRYLTTNKDILIA